PPPTEATRCASSRVARWRGVSPREGLDGRQRRELRDGRLARREPAFLPAGAAKPARVEERVRAGRVRLVLGAPGRHPRLLVPRPRRAGGRTRGGDGGGPRRRRRPAPGAGGPRGGPGRPRRLL